MELTGKAKSPVSAFAGHFDIYISSEPRFITNEDTSRICNFAAGVFLNLSSYTKMVAPRVVKRSVDGSKQVEIATIDPDLV